MLAYKKKRRIINPAYQTQADDIVGKMTLDRLDREMLARELRSRGRPSCGDEIRGGGAVVKAAAPTKAARAGLTASSVQAVAERLP